MGLVLVLVGVVSVLSCHLVPLLSHGFVLWRRGKGRALNHAQS